MSSDKEPPLFNSTTAQKLAPNSQESEEAVIGSVLINPEVLPEIEAILHKGESFYYMHHRMIWQAMLRIADRFEDIDALTVVEELRGTYSKGDPQNYLDKIGGSAFITYLINNTPTHVHALTYSRIVERLHGRRRMLDAASQLAQKALADDIDVDRALDDGISDLKAIQSNVASYASRTLSEAADDRLNYLKALSRGEVENRVVSTGFAAIDDKLADGGFAPGVLAFILGRPAMGKTAFIAALIRAIAQAGHEILFATLEMSESEVVDRLLSTLSGVDSKKIKQAKMNDEEWAIVEDANEVLKQWPVILKDRPGQTLTQIKSECRAAKRNNPNGFKGMFIDYLQIMNMSDISQKNSNRTQDIATITRELKELAKELQIFIIVAAQINRGSEQRADHKPTMADARESDSIAFDADIVFAPFRPDYYDPSLRNASGIADMLILLLKVRNGEQGEVAAKFNSRTVEITPASDDNVLVQRVNIKPYMETGMILVDGQLVDPNEF